MDIEKLVSIFESSDLSKGHSDFIKKIARPIVDMQLVGYDNQRNSKFGGVPLVSNDFELPKPSKGNYRFLGQIDFSEVPGENELLPNNGLLSLYFNWDEDGEAFWGDDGYVLGFYWPDISVLNLIDETKIDNIEPKSIEFTNSVMTPQSEELLENWDFDSEAIYELADDLRINENYLLGYPTFNTLAYDPTPGPEWVPLLNLISRDDMQWYWHDFDRLMVFVEKERLLNNDFSRLKSDAG